MIENTNSNNPKKNTWLQTGISIIIGILVTVGTTWYTIYLNKEESEKSEQERFNKVKDNLVSIIEEHIVNKDSIDFISLNRIINNRIKEENLYKKPEILDLLSLAEYNIQNSKHLSFEKKIEYSRILSKQFKTFKVDTTSVLNKSRFPEEVKELNKIFNNINSSSGKESLAHLVNKYEKEINNLQEKKISKDSLSDYIFKSPTRIILTVSFYALLLIFYSYYIRIRKRKRELQKHRLVIRELEIQQIKDEIDLLVSKTNSADLSNQERLQLRDRIEYLFEKLRKIEIEFK